MPERRTTVLSVGVHPELMGLRNYVLQEAGFEVTSTLHEHEAIAQIERGECEVLLMCYSLPREVRRRLTEALKRFCPGSRSVAITNKQMDKPEFADTYVYGVEGPEALIQAVRGSMSAEA